MEPHKDPVLHDFARLVRRRAPLIVLIAVVVSAGTYYLTTSSPPNYKAAATLTVEAETDTGLQLSTRAGRITAADIRAYQVAATSYELVGQVLANAGLPADPQAVSDAIADDFAVSTEANNRASILTIEATATSAELAADLANGLASAVIGWDRNRANMVLDQSVTALEGQVAELTNLVASGTATDPAAVSQLLAQQQLQLVSLSAFRGHAPASITLLTAAVPPVEPAGLSPLVTTVLAFLIGAAVALAGFMALAAFDDRFATSRELASYTRLPILGRFGRIKGRKIPLPVESLSHLRSSILSGPDPVAPQVLLITSASPGEGKSQVAIGLAKNLARHGRHVLLVEANRRYPQFTSEFGVRGRPPADLISQLRRPLEEVEAITVSDGRSKMDMVPVLEAREGEDELFTLGMPTLITRWRAQYDAIVIDSSAVLPCADPLTIAPLSDAVALVVELEATKRQEVSEAIDLITRASGRLMGLVTTGGSETSNRPRASRKKRATENAWSVLSDWRSTGGGVDRSAGSAPVGLRDAAGRQI